jgi:hypothetical protein
MAFRFEFDSANRILLLRVDGRLTDELLGELYKAIRKYSTVTDARAGILDFSSVTEFAVSSEIIRQFAHQEPAMPDASRPRIVVAPQTHAFGLSRMFQLTREDSRPRLTIVHTMGEAFAALGVQSPQFEPLE